MIKTEQQILHSLLLTPGSGINVEDYRKLCEQMEKESRRIVYIDTNSTELQKRK